MRREICLPGTSTWGTFVDLLRARAAYHPERRCFTFLIDGEAPGDHLTYGALDARSRAIAAWLQQQRAAGERVLLMHPPGLEYVAAFFGCMYAGAVAVPVHWSRRSRSYERIRAIIEDARPALALSLESQRQELERRASEDAVFAGLRLQASDMLGEDLADGYREPDIGPDTLAFLQYTSGSTGSPRGVMVCHRNLLANQQLIQQAFENSERSIGLGWLPLYHDMGLVGMVLQTPYVGAYCLLMSPTAFLRRPVRWLRAISRYRVTTSGGPNFAYELCLREITPAERAGLDLSCWEVAFNGAEPIRADTLERFADSFAPCGFRRESLHPCYGLAEGTLMVTGGTKGAPAVVHTVDAGALARHEVISLEEVNGRGRRLVSSGRRLCGETLRIVDPQTRLPCPPGRIGEIWVSGPSVALGYWNQPAATEETFRAALATGEGPFLRTGDLGFLHGGELYVTGRGKDVIIVHGCNHYPQDIECSVAQSHAAFAGVSGAAFSVDIDGQERLVVVQEVGRRWPHRLPVDELAEAARAAVYERHELQVYELVLVKQGSVPKTSSGKVRRGDCREAYLAGTLPVIQRWRQEPACEPAPQLADEPAPLAKARSREAIQSWLVARLAQRLKLHPSDIDVEKRFSSFGFDSVEAVCLTNALQESLGRPLSPLIVFEHPNIRKLANHLTEQLAANPETGQF